MLRYLNALLFDVRVHNKWSYEQLPMVQHIMNSVEKTSTGVTPAEKFLNNAIRLARILAPPTSLGSAQWMNGSQSNTVARKMQLASDDHGSPSTLSTPTCSSQLPSADQTSYSPGTAIPEKTDSIYVIEDLVSGKRTTNHIHNL